MPYTRIVEIEYAKTRGDIFNPLINDNGNNVSQPHLLSYRSRGKKGMYLTGGSVLNGEHVLFDNTLQGKYPGFNSQSISNANPDSNGNYAFLNAITIEIDIERINPPPIFIVFDEIANEYATEINIEVGPTSTTYYNYQPIFYFAPSIFTFSNKLLITLRAWNKPLCVAKITSITSTFISTYYEDDIHNLEHVIQERPGDDPVQYGVSSLSGKTQLFNKYREFTQLNEYGLLKENLKVTISIAEGTKITKLNTLRIAEWTFDENNPLVGIRLTDKTQKWNQQKYRGTGLANRSVYNLLEEVLQEAGMTWSYVGNTQNILQGIAVPTAYLLPDTYWNTLNKICNFAGLRITQNRYENLEVRIIR